MKDAVLDVKGKSLGRAASEAAILLRGKDQPEFTHTKRPSHKLTIKNVETLQFHPAKMRTKFYKDYSGYPGGLKETSLKDLWAKNPRDVFKRAVWGMLPKNRSRKHVINNLRFE